MVIRVLLAESHPLVREETRVLLERNRDIEVVSAVGDGEEAVASALRLRPDVLIIDARMPGLNGIDVTRRLHVDAPATAVLVLGAAAEECYATAALEAGASGYLAETVRLAELADAVRRGHRGQDAWSPA